MSAQVDFDMIPPEIRRRIIGELDIKDRKNLRAVSRTENELVQSTKLEVDEITINSTTLEIIRGGKQLKLDHEGRFPLENVLKTTGRCWKTEKLIVEPVETEYYKRFISQLKISCEYLVIIGRKFSAKGVQLATNGKCRISLWPLNGEAGKISDFKGLSNFMNLRKFELMGVNNFNDATLTKMKNLEFGMFSTCQVSGNGLEWFIKKWTLCNTERDHQIFFITAPFDLEPILRNFEKIISNHTEEPRKETITFRKVQRKPGKLTIIKSNGQFRTLFTNVCKK